MKPRLPESFERLISTYYGVEDRDPKEPRTVEELFSSYYGGSSVRLRPKSGGTRALARSLSGDDGTTLTQRSRKRARPPSISQAAPASRPLTAENVTAEDRSATREREVDLAPTDVGVVPPECTPSGPQPTRSGPSATSGATSPAFPAGSAPVSPPTLRTAPETVPEKTLGPPSPGPTPESAVEGQPAGSESTQDELVQDLKAILEGRKGFDPRTNSMVDVSDLKDARPPGAAAPAAPPPATPQPGNDAHAIFDRIAQSMEYANAFDLGTVELQNRFADFDRMADLKRGTNQRKKATPPRVAARTPVASSAEFMQDLDAIQTHGLGVATPQSATPPFSEALYGTGEHVLAGTDLYPNAFHVGKPTSVLFSYGEIIAMADLYGSAKELKNAPTAELNALKALIVKSTAHARNRSLPNATDEEWNKATNYRYTKLAEDNYTHFAPNILFPSGKKANMGNHRDAWADHHRQAIRESQAFFINSPMSANVAFPEEALLINAFGDHFLTDAFAAGHLINKEDVIGKFRTAFYASGKLNAGGRQFFQNLAEQSFRGEVREKFRKLETATPYDAWWNIFRWNPNITNADRFAQVLMGAAEQAPEKIANMAVKAIHDRLNVHGIMVTNRAGHAPWHLTGDGHLTTETLGIMEAAVRQSAANITDPEIFMSNPPLDPLIARVWDHVPALTPSSETEVKNLVTHYVRPGSAELLQAAAALIAEELDLLIKILIDKGALQKA
jgi:hypothetical protein